MTIRAFPTKSPTSRLRHYFDWAPWVTIEAGGTIVSFTVSIVDGDGALTIDGSVIGTGAYASMIMVWLSGGTAEVTYTVQCDVTLTDGSTEPHSRTVTIDQH